MGTTVYDGHQRLRLASCWFYQDRLYWVSIWNREHCSSEIAQGIHH